MKKILKNWLHRFVEVETVIRIVVLDHKPMDNREYVYAFLIDDNHPFVRAIYQLCDTMKNDFMDQAGNPVFTDRARMDAIAGMSAIDEFKRNVVAQKITAVKERDKQTK